MNVHIFITEVKGRGVEFSVPAPLLSVGLRTRSAACPMSVGVRGRGTLIIF